MFTPKQLHWAANHDWFVGLTAKGEIIARDQYALDGALIEGPEIIFRSFAKLRDWAGY